MAEGVSRDAGLAPAPDVGGMRTPYVAGQLDQGMHLRPRLEGMAVPPRFDVIRAPWTAGAAPVHVIAYVARVSYASPVRRVLRF